MTRGLLRVAALLALAGGAEGAGGGPLAAQVDTTGAARDTLVQRDTTRGGARDTAPAYLPVVAEPTPPGPLPRGTRYRFTADSFALSGIQTLSDLLTRIPGVYVARGGIYGQAEIVLYGGRGAAGLEVYWDGLPYLPIGRDSVFLDPARISLAPLERVDVVVLPATLRVYLVTRRQSSTATGSAVGVMTGDLNSANYRGAFLRRWRSGLGLSLVADYNNTDGVGGSSSTPFSSVDLWLNAEYIPSPKVGVSYQILSSAWHRHAVESGVGSTDAFRYERRDRILRLFAAARDDGLGPRVQLTFATASARRDTAVADRSLSQGALELSSRWARGTAGLVFRTLDEARPWQLEGTAAWMPRPWITLAADGRHARYGGGRNGDRAHVAAGVALPLGFSLRGDVAWQHDLQAPVDSADRPQRAVDVAGAVRWDVRRISLEVGGATRDSFTPIGRAAGLKPIAALGPTQRARYVTVNGSVELLPGLYLAGWYFDPLVQTGQDFEPPLHGRVSLTFYSKFWRVYRSGVFALRLEGAMESWSRGTAGLDSTGDVLLLRGATFADVNVEIRIAGATLFYLQRNANLSRRSYVPGLQYARRYQVFGVRWLFTN